LFVSKQDSVGDLGYISKLSQVLWKSNLYAKGRGLFEKEVTNPKTNPSKFVQALIRILGKNLGIIRYFRHHAWCFTRRVLPQTPTFNVMSWNLSKNDEY
jgi:hypothetical protein